MPDASDIPVRRLDLAPPSLVTTLVVAVLVALGSGCAARGAPSPGEATGPGPAGEAAGGQVDLPSEHELERMINVLGFDQALRRYGQPDDIEEADKLLEATWEFRRRGEPCELNLSFNRKTSLLLRFRFGCR